MIHQKHAYLIMAHNNFYCLEKLLLLLDDMRNDIFLHIDAKVKNFDYDYYRGLCKNANIIYPPKRIDVRWGTQSQVKTEMLLFQTAYNHGTYGYYHLLSGSDLPLKTQDELHQFFQLKTECFITIHEHLTTYDYQRISRYHGLFGQNGRVRKRLNSYCGIIQEKLGVDRTRKMRHLTIRRGWNWVSLPSCAVELLIAKRSFIRKITRFSVCADEMYKQIVLLNANREDIQICENRSSMRLVDWKRGAGNHPHIFTAEDFEMLCQSSMLFARKFDEKVDKQIIDMIFYHILKKQQAEARNENRNCNCLRWCE